MTGSLGKAAALAGLVAAATSSCRAAPAAKREGREPPAVIRLKGDETFRARAASALERLQGTATGRRLFRELSGAGRTLTLRRGGLELSGAVLYPTGGGDSVVLWDPDFSLEDSPGEVLLYHELVHALHEARSDRIAGKEEELRAVGLGAHADYPLSENALRRELGLPSRRTVGLDPKPPTVP